MKLKEGKLHLSKGLILLLIFILSLVTIFWVKPGEIIDGNDTTYPLDPVGFFNQRLYQWNSSVGAGIDFSHGSAGLSWHGVQALISLTGLPLWLSQKLFLFLLFNVLSFSFYFFISRLTKNKIAIFAGTVFYMFNSYLFNLWGNIQSSALCAYALIPLASGLFLQALSQPEKKLFWSIIFGLSTVFLSAFGMNPGIIIVIFLYSVLFLAAVFRIKTVKEKSVPKKAFIQTLAFFIFGFIIFNLFWLIPEIFSAIGKGYSLNILSSDNRGWLDFVSAHTSIFNVLRVQGEWMWYSTHKGLFYLPYAQIIKNNPFFILLSLLGFGTSAIAVIKSRNRWVVFFVLVLIIGLLASVGSKPPLGYVYLFLAEKTKLLSLLRAPWYKFGMLICLSYAVLTALFVDLFKANKQVAIAFILCSLQLVYAFPLVSGKIFPTDSALPFKFKVPDYVFQTDKWLKNNQTPGEIIMLPRQGELDYYSWGNSSSPFLNLLANPNGVLTEPSWTVSSDTNAGNLLRRFYDRLQAKNSSEAGKILDPLNVKYLILKNDALFNYDQDFGSPDVWRKDIDFQEGFKKEKTFGEWEIFSTSGRGNNRFIYGANNISVVSVEPYLLADYFLFDNKGVVVEDDGKFELTDLNLSYGSVGFSLEKNMSFQPLPVYIRFGADNFLYPFIIKKEKKILSKVSSPLEKINNLMVFSSKRLLEAEKVENSNALFSQLLDSYYSNLSSVQKEIKDLPGKFDMREVETFQSSLFYLNSQNEKLNKMLLAGMNSAKISATILLNNQIAEEATEKLSTLVSTTLIKKYYVRVEKEGDYQANLLDSELAETIKKGQEWKIKVNQQDMVISLDKNTQSPGVILGKVHLKNGDNFVEITLPFALERELSFVVVNDRKKATALPLPDISYTKISPAKYEVDIKGAVNDFVLVFSQNYHFNWQAKIIEDKKVVNAEKHFKANGFANGWLIQKKGDFKIELEYKTQKIYSILLLLTGGLFLSALTYLSLIIVKWKKNGKNIEQGC